MNRRDFMRFAGISSAVAATLPYSFNVYGQQQAYAGKLLITIQAEGGWDITSLCDPKENVAGEEIINQWANSGETQLAGNISYAPVGNNKAFFDKYYKDMLVINGIDSQTNSHSAGVIHNWSGRLSEGYPSLTALFSAANAPEMPIAYINNGGYSQTNDLIRYTRLDEVGSLQNIIYSNQNQWDANKLYMHSNDWNLLNQARNNRINRLAATDKLTLRQKLARGNYKSAIENTASLTDFANTINSAGELQAWEDGPFGGSSLKRQAQLALLAMKSGVSCAADLVMWGYDTHDNHDAQHEWLFDNLTSSIDYLWTYAEQLGIADRLVVVIGSDFGRTPRYNDTNGKDHWPITSNIIMEKDASWGNQVIGLTDESHNAIPINSASLAEDQQAGTHIYPKHVMDALRQYLGMGQHEIVQPYAFNNAETFNFFGG